jgi:ADP-ribose pyrophosphatase YjhB (NUDIX family)
VPAKFCVKCGHATAPLHEHGQERARCPACGWVDYANPVPAAGAILARGGKILLSLRARPPRQGQWDLPGGFLEGGEHPEEGLRRELKEETGLDARVVRLVDVGVGGYDDGRATLNLVYLCEAEGEPRAADDSEALRWFDPRALPRMAWPHEEAAIAKWLRTPASG